MSRAVSALRLRRRARYDHRIARGTQHLKQLEHPLSKLKRDIKAIQNEIRTTRRRIDGLADQREDELRKALSRYLVSHRLTEVDGIGPRLARRILTQCFRGNLRDLRSVERVSGVEPARRAAISRWVYARERELPRLMKEPFPGREEITKKYEAKTVPLERRLNRACETLEEKEALHESVSAAVSKLKSVRVSHFSKALREDSSDVPVPNWYIEGVFPAWESAPDWFVAVLKEYGG
ncbi:MAG: hypothetical protein ACOC8C_01770 [Chloroflexota bacterium]